MLLSQAVITISASTAIAVTGILVSVGIQYGVYKAFKQATNLKFQEMDGRIKGVEKEQSEVKVVLAEIKASVNHSVEMQKITHSFLQEKFENLEKEVKNKKTS
jgi:hypothetical protein